MMSYKLAYDTEAGYGFFYVDYLSKFVMPNSDGAALIDSITVADSTGVIDYEDWEDATVGASVSTDGDWFSGATSYFGDWAGLVDGTTVVQEDVGTMNSTHFWGFGAHCPDLACSLRVASRTLQVLAPGCHSGRNATMRVGPPLPPSIFIGSANTVAPFAGI